MDDFSPVLRHRRLTRLVTFECISAASPCIPHPLIDFRTFSVDISYHTSNHVPIFLPTNCGHIVSRHNAHFITLILPFPFEQGLMSPLPSTCIECFQSLKSFCRSFLSCRDRPMRRMPGSAKLGLTRLSIPPGAQLRTWPPCFARSHLWN